MAADVPLIRYLSIGGTDVSTKIRNCEVHMDQQLEDKSAMGDTVDNFAPSTRKDYITATFIWDFTTSAGLESLMSGMLGSATGSTIIARPSTAAASSSNPNYTMVGTIDGDYSPIQGERGKLNLVTLKFSPVNGTGITRAYS